MSHRQVLRGASKRCSGFLGSPSCGLCLIRAGKGLEHDVLVTTSHRVRSLFRQTGGIRSSSSDTTGCPDLRDRSQSDKSEFVLAPAPETDIIVTTMNYFVKAMKDLSPYIDLLSPLPWKSIESKEMLALARSCRKRSELLALIGTVTGTEPADLTLDLVRDLDYRARDQARSEDVAAAEKLWVLARLVEYLLSLNQRPLCKFCYRTVGLRTNGRLKDLCPHHATGKDSGRTAEYQRGRKHQHDMERLLSLLPSAEEFAQALLTYQLNSLRAKGGAPATIISRFDFNDFIADKFIKQMNAASNQKNADDSSGQATADAKRQDSADESWDWAVQLDEAAGGSGLWRISRSELGIADITQDYPDWTELAMRWRAQFADLEGLQKLNGVGESAVTPLMLIEQWLRWKAWTVRGDSSARVGKGRPSKFDHEEALRLRAQGMRVSAIAKHFPEVHPKYLTVFFSRWDLAHIDREQALKMRNEGKTDAEIAAHFSVSTKSVTKVLASEEGVPD
jgi:uncharacterized protein (DUF433 family)